MSRLIDADALVRDHGFFIEDEDGFPTCVVCETDIRYYPTIDAVPVVRCAECKRCFVKETKRHKQPMWICMRDDLNVCVHPHHFCSYGERRSE